MTQLQLPIGWSAMRLYWEARTAGWSPSPDHTEGEPGQLAEGWQASARAFLCCRRAA